MSSSMEPLPQDHIKLVASTTDVDCSARLFLSTLHKPDLHHG